MNFIGTQRDQRPGRLIVVSGSDTLTTSKTWNCDGEVVLSSTDANGNSTSFGYTNAGGAADPFWRVSSVTDPLGNTIYTNYTATSVNSHLAFGSSVVDKTTYLDGLGRPNLTQTQEGPSSGSYDSVSTTYGWNGTAFQTGKSMPCVQPLGVGCTSYFTYSIADPLGRPLTAQDAGGGTLSGTYPQNDAKVTVGPAPAGENAKNVQTEYDGLGRRKSTCQILSSGGSSCGQNTAASGYLTSYAYSTFSGGTQVSATRGAQTRTSVYDALGRLSSQANPESGTTTNLWDAAPSACNGSGWATLGDLGAKMDNAGVYICYGYDALHRVTGWLNTNHTTCVGLVYDTPQGTLPSGITISNGAGRLIEAYTNSACNGKTSMVTDEYFSYDKDGRLTDVYELTPHSGGYYHTTAGFFPNGVLSSLSGLPGLATYTYTPDGEGRSNTAVQGTNTFINGVSYNAASQPTTVRVGTLGDQDSYTYDPATGRMTGYTFTVNLKSESAVLQWNANGTLRQLAITDGFDSGGTQTCNFGTSSVMGYDDLGRLLSDNCGSLWSQTFSYDQYDNVTKSGTISWMPGYNAANNRYSSIGATYDADGNLTYDSFNTYTWDAYGKMASARGGTAAATCGTNGTCVTYDALGRAVEKNVSGTYTEILYSPLGKTAIMNGQTLTNAYVPMPGGESSMYEVVGGHHVEHRDWRGSVVLRTSLNNRSKDYDRAFAAFGEMYDNFGSSGLLNFTRDTQDLFAGLFDTPNRELAPTQGRWISPDPAGAGWNLYAYVSNNPLSLTDPSGLRPHRMSHFGSNGLCYDETDLSAPCINGGDPGDFISFSHQAIIWGNDIFDAIEGTPGTFMYQDMHGNVGFGFSVGLWSTTNNFIDALRSGQGTYPLYGKVPNSERIIQYGTQTITYTVSTVGWNVNVQDIGSETIASGFIQDAIRLAQQGQYVMNNIPPDLQGLIAAATQAGRPDLIGAILMTQYPQFQDLMDKLWNFYESLPITNPNEIIAPTPTNPI